MAARTRHDLLDVQKEVEAMGRRRFSMATRFSKDEDMKLYIIGHIDNPLEEKKDHLFWNNDSGWGSFETADKFEEWEILELELPWCGEWIEFKK